MVAVSAGLKNLALRLILPAALGAAAVIRPSFISLLYGICALASVAVPSVGVLGVPRVTKAYLSLCLGVALIGTLAQAAFQITIVASAGNFSPSCVRNRSAANLSATADIFFHLGLQQWSGPVQAARILLSDLLALLFSFLTAVICLVFSNPQPSDEFDEISEGGATSGVDGGSSELSWKDRLMESLLKSTDIVAVLILLGMGTVGPSVLCLLYFLGFLVLLTWWALYRPPLRRPALNRFKSLILLYAALHIVLLYLYQLPAAASALQPSSLFARLGGFWQVTTFTCKSERDWEMKVEVNEEHHWLWQISAAPIVLVLGYFALAYQLRLTLDGTQAHTRGPRRTRDDNSSVHEELLQSGEEGGDGRGGGGDSPSSKANWFGRAVEFLVSQAWALTLLAMIAWAVIYHSGFGFILLIVSCALWSFPSTTKATYAISPIIVVYAEVLLLIQYFYSLNFKPDEVPLRADSHMQDLGLYQVAGATCFPLWIKSLLSLPFFLTMRLRLEQTITGSSAPRRSYGTFAAAAKSGPGDGAERGTSGTLEGGLSESSLVEARSCLSTFLGKYFIFLVVGVLLIVAIRPQFAIYSLGYLVFFVLIVILLQLSFALFRRSIYWILSVALLYSGFVVIWIYAFQFTSICQVFKNESNASVALLKDLGVDCEHNRSERISGRTLLEKLLTPLAVLLVVVMQCKFFHNTWRSLTEVRPLEEGAGERRRGPAWKRRLLGWLDWLSETLWRAAEIHWWKVVAFSFVCVCAVEVSAMNGVLMLLLCLILPGRLAQPLLFFLATLWLSVVFFVKEVFQLAQVEREHINLTFGCPGYWSNYSVASWVGFKKVVGDGEDVGWELAKYVAGVVLALLCLGMDGVVRARMAYWRKCRSLDTPARPLIIPGYTHQRSNDDLRSMCAFLVNFFFYKFGLELCFISTMVVAAVRLDFVGLVYVILLLVLFCLPRRSLRLLWWPYVFVLTVLFGLQYAICVQIPCINWPWPTATEEFNGDAVKWFFLPSPEHDLVPTFLIADFFQLLFVACQAAVFSIERNDPDGGSNEEVWRLEGGLEAAEENPYEDFMEGSKILDTCKKVFFAFFQWVTLIVLFVAGLGAISVFAFIYLIAAFLFLWKGNDLYLKPGRWVMGKWRAFTILCICVVLSKVALQIVGCVYIHHLVNSEDRRLCWLVQLFSIVCVHSNFKSADNSVCSMTGSVAAIKYDVVAFAFLLVQLRILGSFYFRHVVDELRAERILSSRGAVLINTLIRQEMREETEKEAQRIAEIKAKASSIRQQALDQAQKKRELGPRAYDEHAGRYYDPQTYAAAKRAGDRWMFAGDPDAASSLPEKEDEVGYPEVTPGASEQPGKDPLERIHDLVQADLDFEKANANEDGDEMAPPPFAESVDEESEKEGAVGAALRWIKDTCVSGLNWLTAFFNRRSRDHRYVAYALDQEKQKLKSQIAASVEANRLDAPALGRKSIREFREELLEGESAEEILYSLKTEEEVADLAEHVEEYWKKGNPVSRLLFSLGMLLVSHTELICYMLMFLNHAQTAAVLSMPLPLMALLWGTLSSPRPAKFFWIVVIAYTEGLVVVKFLFQFNFFKWGTSGEAKTDPFWPPRILGIERKDLFAAWDVALLIALFFHRYMMRKLGLWKDAQHVAAEEEDAKSQQESALAIQNGDAGNSMELKELRTEDASHVVTEEPSKESGSGGWLAYLGCCGDFYRRLIHPPFRYIRDMYPLLFLSDLICFLILVFRYPDFGVAAGEGDVLADVTSNRIPLLWVIMLLVLTVLIILDRGLYLRKAVTLKIVFQYALVIFIHVYIFFVLPKFTGRSPAVVASVQAFYIIKCVYFLFSAWQIRNGYPTQVVGNLLTRTPDLTSFGLFSVFFAVPFLFEIRTLIDWIWTDTSMPLFDFFTMENFYAVIFKTKCGREIERRFPAPRGVAKGKVVKYLMGGGMLAVIILLIFLPLLLYSLLNYIGEQFLPETVVFSITISGYPPLYSMISKRSFLRSDEEVWSWMDHNIGQQPKAYEFLKQYSYDDMQLIGLRRDSLTTWDISPPSLEALRNDLGKNCFDNGTSPLFLTVAWKMTRAAQKGKPVVEHSGERSIKMVENLCKSFSDALNPNSTGTARRISLREVYPPFLLLPPEGETQVPPSLYWWAPQSRYSMDPRSLEGGYTNLSLSLNTKGNSRYWEAESFPNKTAGPCDCKGVPKHSNYSNPCCQPKQIPGEAENTFPILVVVDKLFPSFLSSFIKGGIIAVYISLVIVVGRLLRGIVVGSPLDVILKEMPCVDRLFKICQDLYLVRESRDFAMEQDIFAKLIFLFRSPETLINWTRPPPEKEKED